MNPHQPYHIRRFPLRPRSVVTPPASKERSTPATEKTRVKVELPLSDEYGGKATIDWSPLNPYICTDGFNSEINPGVLVSAFFREKFVSVFTHVRYTDVYVDLWRGEHSTVVVRFTIPAKPATRTPAPLSPRLREALQRTCPKPRTKTTP